MNFPTTGRIVVIDDTIDEALPLIQVLSQKGISVKYFNGELETLPEQPIEGVRIVFLDIELGTLGQDTKSKVSKVITILSRVIGQNPNPYVIIAWTKHSEVIDDIEKGLSQPPVKFLDMRKIDCKDENGQYDLKIISENFMSAVQSISSFQAFLIWEELINQAANSTINDTFSLFNTDDDWDSKVQNVLYNLAKAKEGNQLKENILQPAFKALNEIYFEYLDGVILNHPEVNNRNAGLPFLNKDRLSPELISFLNTKLICSSIETTEVVPGNIYFCNIKRVELSTLMKKYEDDWEPLFLLLEISPSCDYAQDKWKVSRVLPGVLVPVEYEKNIKKAEYIYKTQLIKLNNVIGYLVFDIREFSTINFEQLMKNSSYYRIKKELVVDIQSKISNHVSRPGYMALT